MASSLAQACSRSLKKCGGGGAATKGARLPTKAGDLAPGDPEGMLLAPRCPPLLLTCALPPPRTTTPHTATHTLLKSGGDAPRDHLPHETTTPPHALGTITTTMAEHHTASLPVYSTIPCTLIYTNTQFSLPNKHNTTQGNTHTNDTTHTRVV
ncbi:hypothetical protein E2C01_073594 [Portunus trituberculatus]|uniref:Uncharacterized protein n=1 Tax=Portunus trituberculatus TaxID=210409 RepID=A0A5B7I5R4_PORTR|nr:hypothetical protein [Portunus trituberculatus]